jgi:CheY-like chemotaxis protein
MVLWLAMQDTRILLVEDDVFLHQIYTDTLKEAGYTVDEVFDGDSAYEKMHTGGYTLVLLDMMLPGKTGAEVMQALQANPPQNKNRKVIFLTNTDNPHDIELIKSLSDGYLKKSDVTPDQFIQRVQEYLK